MSREYIITMTAENRVGILAAVTNAMNELGADLVECSQTVVSGYFTMIFSARFPENREKQIIFDHLSDACRTFDLEVTVSLVNRDREDIPNRETVTKRLRLVGQNSPGILRRIAVKMSINQIDIIGMHAWRQSEERFDMVMKIAVPTSFPADDLEDELQSIDPAWELRAALEDLPEAPGGDGDVSFSFC